MLDFQNAEFLSFISTVSLYVVSKLYILILQKICIHRKKVAFNGFKYLNIILSIIELLCLEIEKSLVEKMKKFMK